jgi:hypothetical protein
MFNSSAFAGEMFSSPEGDADAAADADAQAVA